MLKRKQVYATGVAGNYGCASFLGLLLVRTVPCGALYEPLVDINLCSQTRSSALDSAGKGSKQALIFFILTSVIVHFPVLHTNGF